MLDAYHGDGVVWDEVRARVDVPIVTVGVDLKPGKAGAVVRVDNRAALSGWDLDGFDAIDLDAYGWPTEQVAIVAKRGFGGPVFVTQIHQSVGFVPADRDRHRTRRRTPRELPAPPPQHPTHTRRHPRYRTGRTVT